jgi:monoamine oxidase
MHDIVILGGGIAGIYTAYQLTKLYPHLSIILLEQTKLLGGRVHTIYHAEDMFEAGAGRFSDTHTNLLDLITELGLDKYKTQIGSDSSYYPIDHLSPKYSLEMLILNVVARSKFQTREYLQTISFLDYAKTILSNEEANFIKDSFGYYSELVIMNAHDAIQLIQKLGPTNTFYVLTNGLSQILNQMISVVKTRTTRNMFYTNQTVTRIQEIKLNDDTRYKIHTQNKEYTTRIIISALPKQALEKIQYFKPIYPLLNQIKCAPLCRIYCKFETPAWFVNLPKIRTNNNLRMMIPWNAEKGTIMLSYTDNKYADYWNDLYEKKGMNAVNSSLRKLVQETTGQTIPEKFETYIYYWKCGVGYWGIGANSQEISQKMIQPFPNQLLFCCGEHFSENNQQWMEGALETSLQVISKIQNLDIVES